MGPTSAPTAPSHTSTYGPSSSLLHPHFTSPVDLANCSSLCVVCVALWQHPGLSRDPSLGLKLWSVSAALTGVDMPTSSSPVTSPTQTPHHTTFGTEYT